MRFDGFEQLGVVSAGHGALGLGGGDAGRRARCGRAGTRAAGGSSSRMVTGRPSIASRMPMKSCRCSGSSALESLLALGLVPARIIASTSLRRSPRNMCSVRHRPMPCGAEPAGAGGVLGGVGVGPHLQPPYAVGSSMASGHGVDQSGRRSRRSRSSASPPSRPAERRPGTRRPRSRRRRRPCPLRPWCRRR